MSKFEEIQRGLIHELCQMDIEEIERIREEWIVQLGRGASEKVMFYCNSLTDLVIQKKMEKMNILKGGEGTDKKTESKSYLRDAGAGAGTVQQQGSCLQ